MENTIANPAPSIPLAAPAAAAADEGAGPGAVMEGRGGSEALAAVFASHARVHDGAEGALQHFERVVAWQEKIFSASEVDERKRQQPETELERRYAAMIRDGQLAGEVIYTYVAADAFADERDADHRVTTSESEPFNGLYKAVFGTPRARTLAHTASGRGATRMRTELARGRRRRGGAPATTFAICADCGPLQLPTDRPAFGAGGDEDDEQEQVLMTIEAYPDGSIALSSDFTPAGEHYRIERRDGSVFQYSVTNASTRDETPLEKRDAAIAPTAALRRLQLLRRTAAGVGAFAPSPGPAPGALRLVVLGEIVAGRGFEHDNLYCEWVLDIDPLVWKLVDSSGGGGDGAMTAGVTQISRTTVYPPTGDGDGDGAFSADRLVAHWSLPIELELVAQQHPAPAQYPTVYFQVSSYDSWDRYRCEGYGHLQLGGVSHGSVTHRIKTWRAGGSVRDRVATHFVGGAPEVGDVTYAGTPRDIKGTAVHSRLGFVADSSGEIKVRTNIMSQSRGALSGGAAVGLSMLRRSVLPDSGGGSGGRGAGGATDRRLASVRNIAEVVERARARLAEARAEGRLNPNVAPRALLLSRAQQQRGAPESQAPTPRSQGYQGAAPSAYDGVKAAELTHLGGGGGRDSGGFSLDREADSGLSINNGHQLSAAQPIEGGGGNVGGVNGGLASLVLGGRVESIDDDDAKQHAPADTYWATDASSAPFSQSAAGTTAAVAAVGEPKP